MDSAENIQLLYKKYPQLSHSNPKLYQELEEREKFYLDLIFSLLNKNKELHHQANINFHAYKQKQAELVALQSNTHEKDVPLCRNVIINFQCQQRDEKTKLNNLPIIEEEQETPAILKFNVETKRSINSQDQYANKVQVGCQTVRIEEAKKSQREVPQQTDMILQWQPTTVDIGIGTVEQLRPYSKPASANSQPVSANSLPASSSSGSINPSLFRSQREQSKQEHTKVRELSLIEQPRIILKPLESAQILQADTVSSRLQTPAATSPVDSTERKLHYRRYLGNDLPNGSHGNISSTATLLREEYLKPQLYQPRLNRQSPQVSFLQSPIEKLKQENRQILKRIEAMGV